MEKSAAQHAPGSIDVSVLVPVYNNAATLDELIDRLVAVFEALRICFEIILVDDGSRDSSLAILKARAARDPRIRPLAMVRNFGSQAASCAACDHARGRRVVHIDADLENFPEDIPRLLEYLDRGYDLVCGYRDNRGGSWLRRRMPSMLMNAYVRRQTGSGIRDVGCGLRALDARLIHDLAAEGEARRLLTPVLLRRAQRVAQVPVGHRPKIERGGHSALTLLGIALDYYMLTAHRPFLVSGLICVAAFPIGLAMIVFGRPLPGLTVIGMAALGGLVSLLGEYTQRLYQLGQGIPFYKLQEPEALEEHTDT